MGAFWIALATRHHPADQTENGPLDDPCKEVHYYQEEQSLLQLDFLSHLAEPCKFVVF